MSVVPRGTVCDEIQQSFRQPRQKSSGGFVNFVSTLIVSTKMAYVCICQVIRLHGKNRLLMLTPGNIRPKPQNKVKGDTVNSK